MANSKAVPGKGGVFGQLFLWGGHLILLGISDKEQERDENKKNAIFQIPNRSRMQDVSFFFGKNSYATMIENPPGKKIWNMVFGNCVAKPAFLTRTSGLQFCPCP